MQTKLVVERNMIEPDYKLGIIGAGIVTKEEVINHVQEKTEFGQEEPSQGKTLPNYDVWKQIIDEVRPALVITAGTARGIGSCVGRSRGRCGESHRTVRLHQVAVRRAIPRCHLRKSNQILCHGRGSLSRKRRTAPRGQHQAADDRTKRRPCIVSVTSDFFGFDTSDNHYGLQGLGDVSEMGDAVLGLVASQMLKPPGWVAVRNVSDPTIKAEGTLRDQAAVAASIYKAFGRWSTVCSAIVCWALIAPSNGSGGSQAVWTKLFHQVLYDVTTPAVTKYVDNCKSLSYCYFLITKKIPRSF